MEVRNFYSNFTKRVTLLNWFFSCFLNCTDGTKLRKLISMATHLFQSMQQRRFNAGICPSTLKT